MTDPEVEDMKEALRRFRSDILTVLAKIDVEITALQWAVIDGHPVTQARLTALRKQAGETVESFRERYAQSIAFGHETR